MMFMPACSAAVSGAKEAQPGIELTLVPPTTITDKVELDIRAGVALLIAAMSAGDAVTAPVPDTNAS